MDNNSSNTSSNISDIVPSSLIAESSSASSLSGDIYSSNENGGFFGNIGIFKWIFIILILAFLGINVFVYLAKGTQGIVDFFAPLIQLFEPIIKPIVGIIAAITGQAVNVSAEGAKAVVGETVAVAGGTINAGLSAVQDVATASTIKGQSLDKPVVDIKQPSSLNNASQQASQDYTANEATSSIGGPKAGWCYIGQDKGVRTCGQVGADDSCMSGNIFPTQEICMNPSLRA
jgi:hypothetical protein